MLDVCISFSDEGANWSWNDAWKGSGDVILEEAKSKYTRSSTETELVGVDDAMPSILWCLYFMQAQGLDMECARIHQDNNSAILLEVNGRMSSSKRTKHIKSKYFLYQG